MLRGTTTQGSIHFTLNFKELKTGHAISKTTMSFDIPTCGITGDADAETDNENR